MKQKITTIFAVIISFYSLVYADPYKFQPGDYINLFVYNAPELCGEFRIYADGFARLPLVGKVRVAGMTEDEAYDSLRLAISEFMKNPNMMIRQKVIVNVIFRTTRQYYMIYCILFAI